MLHNYFAILKFLASRTPTQALRPEARPKGWFQGSVSEENSRRQLPPNHCGDRLKIRREIRHESRRKIRRTLLCNSQASVILQGAARTLTQAAKLGGCVIVQLACEMVQLTMSHALCIRRNHFVMSSHRHGILFLIEAHIFQISKMFRLNFWVHF